MDNLFEKDVFLLQVLPGKLSPEGNDFNVLDTDQKLQSPDIEMVGGFTKK